MKDGKKTSTPWRHSAICKICRHPRRAEIEQMFLQWQPQKWIAAHYNLGNRQTIFRHARATGLFGKRATNVRGVVCALIEKGMSRNLHVSAAVIVQAAALLATLDAKGRAVERYERIGTDSAFLDDPRWTIGEMTRFCEIGELPPWLTESGTSIRASEHENLAN